MLDKAIVPALIGAASLAADCTFGNSRPREYVAYKLESPLILNGDLSKPAWADVPWTSVFVDISTSTIPRLRTRAKLRWDDDFLYVAAELQEPQLWATLTEHDTVIFNDNDFEIFVDANATTWGYKEFEMNAYNATWDLMLNRPYGDGGGEQSCRVDPHPCFDMEPPLASAVRLDGSLNEPSGPPDTGWSVEVALPIKQLMHQNAGADQTPSAGTFWRINFSRVQWHLEVNGSQYVKAPRCQSCPKPGEAAEDNWVWSPQGVIDMHEPERWAIVQFAQEGMPLSTYEEWPARALARALYSAQRAFSDSMNTSEPRFTDDLAALDQYTDPPGLLTACGRKVHIALGANATSFEAQVDSVASPQGLLAQVTDLRFTTVTRRSKRVAAR